MILVSKWTISRENDRLCTPVLVCDSMVPIHIGTFLGTFGAGT